MTMPHLMNCSHSSDGWCLNCVGEQHAEIERLRAALQQACDLWDADNLTTQTYLREWKKALSLKRQQK